VYGEFGPIVTPTQTVSNLEVRIGHRFKVPKHNANVLQVLENIPSSILWMHFCSIVWLLVLLAVKFKRSGLSARRVSLQLLEFSGVWIRQTPSRISPSNRRVPRLTVLAAFTSFFLNIFLETSVKTDRVVLDLSNLLQTIDDVLNTNRIAVWVNLERLNDEFSQARESSWQKKAWQKPRLSLDKSSGGLFSMTQKPFDFYGISNFVYM
jgi:hypothetical protein